MRLRLVVGSGNPRLAMAVAVLKDGSATTPASSQPLITADELHSASSQPPTVASNTQESASTSGGSRPMASDSPGSPSSPPSLASSESQACDPPQCQESTSKAQTMMCAFLCVCVLVLVVHAAATSQNICQTCRWLHNLMLALACPPPMMSLTSESRGNATSNARPDM